MTRSLVSIRSIVAAAAILLLPSAAFSVGHPVTGPAFGPTSYAIRDPLVATNGQSFLALWTTTEGAQGTFIYGSVADANGQKVTEASFRLLPFAAELVDVTTFGSDYLVMWQNATGLHSSIVSGSGVVLRDGPTVAPPTDRFTDVQRNGATLLFTYHTSDPLAWPTETRARVTSLDGTPIGASVLLGDQALQAATRLAMATSRSRRRRAERISFDSTAVVRSWFPSG